MRPITYLIFISFLFGCNLNQASERKIIIPKNDTIQITGDFGILGYIYYDENGKAGLLNESKVSILEPRFDYIEDWLQSGVMQVDSGGYGFWDIDYGGYVFKKIGLVNLNGEVIFKPQFDELYISDNSALVKVDTLFGYVDLKGNWLIHPKYQYAERFDKGAAVVKKNGKIELINKTGQKIIDESIDEAFGFKNGVSMVKKGNKYGFINYEGKYLLPLDDYPSIEEYNWYHGRFQRSDRKYYLIDTAGNLPMKTGVDEVRIVNNRDTIFAIGKNNKKEFKLIIGSTSR